jgi:bisphosphoglycerate-dependent phosphoglycerate mutase
MNSTSNFVCLSVSHQARLRCLIAKLFKNSTLKDDARKKALFKELRWQNCSVVKLVLTPNSSDGNKYYNFMLSLIYSGEIDPSEHKPNNKYWTTKDTDAFTDVNNKFIKFTGLSGQINMSDLSDEAINTQTNKNISMTIYLVRHGQATHNLYSGTFQKANMSSSKQDTKLTNLGRNMAIDAGAAINEDLGENVKINYIFASDLIRTRETLSSLLGSIEETHLITRNSRDIVELDVIILPCSHELLYVSDGNCDSATNMRQPFTPENAMSCTSMNNYNEENGKYLDCVVNVVGRKDNENKTIRVIFDWNFYKKFYDNSYRGNLMNKFSGNKKQCRKTSMIGEMMDIIGEKEQIGGKKTRKYRNKKRNRRQTKRK